MQIKCVVGNNRSLTIPYKLGITTKPMYLKHVCDFAIKVANLYTKTIFIKLINIHATYMA